MYDENRNAKYHNTQFEEWMIPMAKDWSKYNNSNVCTVDWSFLAKGEYAYTVDHQLRRAANELFKFTEILNKHGMSYAQVSVAGHSLGAHVAGLFGSTVKDFGYEIDAIYGMFKKILLTLQSNLIKCSF